MEDKEWFEVQKSNGRLLNEISDQNQGGNEKKNFTKKMEEEDEKEEEDNGVLVNGVPLH